MKRTMLLLATVALFSLAMFAKTPTTPKPKTITGCISGPNAENAYVLTNGTYKKGVEVGGSDDLSKHVGHKVKLTGTWVKTGAEIGEREDAAAEKAEKKTKKEKAEKHFKADNIDMVADSCTMGAAKTSAHHHANPKP